MTYDVRGSLFGGAGLAVLVAAVTAALVCTAPAGADWDPGDDHKMHYPQLPDFNGLDVNFRSPKVLADDWQCSQSGPVTDVHFWFSAIQDWFSITAPLDQQIFNVHVSIHENLPPDAVIPFSRPGALLWERDFGPNDPGLTVRLYGQGQQGWFDPCTGLCIVPDHMNVFQMNIVDIQDPFIQQQGTVYWLDLSISAADLLGWKSSGSPQFMDDGVWSPDLGDPTLPWTPLVYPTCHPLGGQSMDLAFVITGKTPVEPKWSQLPHPPMEGFNVASDVDWQTLSLVPPGDPGPGPNWVVADDFISNGKPITCVRWWGSYIDPAYEPTPDPICVPDPTGQACDPVTCPVAGEECVPRCATFDPATGIGFISDCDCRSPNECQVVFVAGAFPDCIGGCPAGFTCVPTTISNPDGTITLCCDCVPVPSPIGVGPPSGACCLQDGSCTILTEADCIAQNGGYFGDNTICPGPGGCNPPPTGGCCLSTGQCIIATLANCATQGGSYFGDNTICPLPPCVGPPSGACCIPGVGCFVTTATDCQGQGGTYQGDGVPCVPDPCLGGAVGACCVPGAPCFVTTFTDCLAQGGLYQGDGVPCIPDPCGPFGTEVDGWLLSFHTDIPADQNPNGMFSLPGDLLGLYFCPADAIEIRATGIFGWDDHQVYEYVVELADCCLIHSEIDPRPDANPPDPARNDAFLETADLIYWLDIQAVVGHTFVEVQAPCPACDCDLNGDGACDTLDLLILQGCLGGANCPDINCDGVSNLADVTAWQCLAAGNPPDVCCQSQKSCVEVKTENRAFQHFWGWHTSPDHWNDVSVMGMVIHGAGGEWRYINWFPVDGTPHGLDVVDQAFELLTPVVPCPWDFANPPDGQVSILDLLQLLGEWGGPGKCDFDQSGAVDIVDLLKLLGAWGPCP